MIFWSSTVSARETYSDKAVRRCIEEGAVLICKGPKERTRILLDYTISSSRVVTIQEVRGQRLLGSTTPVVIDNLDQMIAYMLGIPVSRIHLVTWMREEEEN